MKKSLFLVVLSFAIILCLHGCRKESNQSPRVIATVNGGEIYDYDVARVKELNDTLNDDEIIALIMKELLVYQEAENLNLTVENYEVEDRINHLITDFPDMYELCIEQYGTEENYKEALKYTILYEKVYAHFTMQYINNLEYDEDEIMNEIEKQNFMGEYENLHINTQEIIHSYLQQKYRTSISEYFTAWNESAYQSAKKVILDKVA